MMRSGNLGLSRCGRRGKNMIRKSAILPFAYRSIKGAMKDELTRRQKGGKKVKNSDLFLEEEEAVEWVAEKLPDWLDAALLSPKEQRLLQEMYIDGYSLTELQKHYGLTLSGMKKRRERAFMKIRAAIPHPYKEH